MTWDDLTQEQKIRALMETDGLPLSDAKRQVAILDGASAVDVVGVPPPAAPLGVPAD